MSYLQRQIDLQTAIAAQVRPFLGDNHRLSLGESTNDYGNSFYVTVYDEINFKQVLKFRISDHNLSNIVRIFTEIDVCANKPVSDYKERIECALYPERYKEVINVTLTFYTESNFTIGTKPNCLAQTPIYIGRVTTKKGNPADRYGWQVESKTYSIAKI